MDVFYTGIIVLLAMTAIFYVAMFSLIFYWHLKKISFVVVPAVFIFEFLAAGFFVVSIAAIIINFLPEIIKFFNI